MNPKNALLIIALMTLAGQGCGSGKSVPTQSRDGDNAISPAASSNKQDDVPPDLILNAKEYAEEYEKNIAKTVQKYDEKRIEVTGFIRSTGHDGLGSYLELGEPDAEKFEVICYCMDSEPWNTALPGQTVCIRGKVSGVFPALQVKNCQIISVKGPLPPSLATSELAKQFKENQKELEKKYNWKYLIVNGEIDSVKHGPQFTEVVIAQNGSNPIITCYFRVNAPVDKERYKMLAPAQKVKVLCVYHGNESSISLGDCHLLK